MLALGLWPVVAQANPLIVGNTAGATTAGVAAPIITYDFATGAVLNSFIPTGASLFNTGRGVVVVGNEVFYTEVMGGSGTDFIRVAPFNGGVGGADTRTLPNPRPGCGIQNLGFSGGVLYALTGYASCNSPPQVFGLDPLTGAIMIAPVTIAGPASFVSDGFTILPNGNFLINSGDGLCTYNQFSPSTGALIPGTTIAVPGAAKCMGVDTDGVSLFFATDFNSFTQTDLSGTLITKRSVGTNWVEDISLIKVPGPVPTDVYAVKFLCGTFRPLPPGAAEGPVKPGNYQTAISVHNPNGGTVNFRKKAIVLYNATHPPAAPETPMAPGAFRIATLNANWGLEIDCRDIRNVLLPPPPVPYPAFLKGWVIIEVPAANPPPLDVVAAYTTHGLPSSPAAVGPGGFSIDVEVIRPTRVSK